MAQTKRRSSQEDRGLKYIVLKLIMGSFAGVVLFFTLLCIAAAIILKHPVEMNFLKVISLFAAALSTFSAGFIAVRPVRKNGILMGLCSGVPVVIVACAAVLFETGGTLGIMTVVMAATMLVCSAVGGIAAVNLKHKIK